LLFRFFFKLTVNYIRTFLFVDSAYVYTVASPSDHVGQEGYWSHIGKKIFDLEDRLYFTILGVCTSNFHRGLFFKYIDCKLYEVDKKVKINDEECEYSLCEEIMDPSLYQFVDSQVILLCNLTININSPFNFLQILLSIIEINEAREIAIGDGARGKYKE
jgi:hypothetical protein